MNKKNSVLCRCNLEGEGLFYLCKKRVTAFSEVGVQLGDTVSLGHYIFRQRKNVVNLTGMVTSDTYGVYGGMPAGVARYFLVLLIENEFKAQGNLEIYKVTSYVSILFKSIEVDGIRYISPHWRNKRDWECVALINDENIEYRYTEQFRINYINKTGHAFKSELIAKRY